MRQAEKVSRVEARRAQRQLKRDEKVEAERAHLQELQDEYHALQDKNVQKKIESQMNRLKSVLSVGLETLNFAVEELRQVLKCRQENRREFLETLIEMKRAEDNEMSEAMLAFMQMLFNRKRD